MAYGGLKGMVMATYFVGAMYASSAYAEVVIPQGVENSSDSVCLIEQYNGSGVPIIVPTRGIWKNKNGTGSYGMDTYADRCVRALESLPEPAAGVSKLEEKALAAPKGFGIVINKIEMKR